MKLFDVLNLSGKIEPAECKIHLASHNGKEDPLDVYFAGKFKEWQEDQNGKNFKLKFIVALIQIRNKNKWLYVGTYKSHGCKPKNGRFFYDTEVDKTFTEYEGRLIINFERTSRQPYLLAENWIDKLIVSEFKAEKLTINDFPGFKYVELSYSDLKLIISENIESWRSALSSVAGIYLITDKSNGKLYVGKASGSGGIWQRWCDYARNGHGGNVDLKELKSRFSDVHYSNFSYSILEILDINTSENEILKRESHWKRILSSIQHGYNKN